MKKTGRGKSVSQKSTAAVCKVATAERKHWFAYAVYGDEPTDPEEEDSDVSKDWEKVETFVSWNEHEDGLTLYIDKKGRVFLIGGEPYKRELSYPVVMRFYADMFRQCKEGGDYAGIETLFNAVAVALERRAL